MAFLLAWFSLGSCLILSVACVALAYDVRGQRKVFGAAEETIAALEKRVVGQEAAIGRLTSALVALSPLALVEEGHAPAQEGEPTPASGERRSAPSQSQRTVLVPTPHVETVPTLRSGARPPHVSARFAALSKTAEAQGLPVEHCSGRDCKGPRGCVCACDACERLRVFERLAEVTPDAAASLVAGGEAALSPEELAGVDVLAAERGITRQEALVLCLLAGRPVND